MERDSAMKKNLRTVHYGDNRSFVEGKNRFGKLISGSKILDGEFKNGKL